MKNIKIAETVKCDPTFIVSTPFLLGDGGGGLVEPPTKFSKRKRGLTRSQLLEGVAGKEWVTFFRRIAIFT